MRILYHGHSCFQVFTGAYTLLIDPYLSGNPLWKGSLADIKATHLLITHGHGDHLGDAVQIARNCGATVIATVETAGLFPQQVATDVGQIGGSIPLPFGRVKFTPALHGSGVPGGLSCGFLLTLEGKKLYHAGDTGLTMEFALLEAEQIDLALIPIGDRYTMGPEDALRFLELAKPKGVIPMHYNTFAAIEQDAAAFVAQVNRRALAEAALLEIGQSITL